MLYLYNLHVIIALQSNVVDCTLLFSIICLKKCAAPIYLKTIQNGIKQNFNNHKMTKCPWKKFRWSGNHGDHRYDSHHWF